MLKIRLLGLFSLLLLLGCKNTTEIDTFSYQLGNVGAFAEMVNAGVKQLALSSPMTTEEMDAFWPEAQKVAEQNKVSLYRETDLITTDLFPGDVAKDKEVLLIYQGQTKNQYLALKTDKQSLIQNNQYQGPARQAIARRFGRLLSYTPQGINQLLARNTNFRTMADYGVQASNVFLYYKDLDRATDFYQNTLGLELVSDYQMATIFRLSEGSFLILVDAEKGMHTAEEPKTVALALLTNQLADWWTYLQEKKVPIKYDYKPKTGNAHDGFVAIDPEGYLLEFETFKQHPENERFMPILNEAPEIKTNLPNQLAFHGSVTWLYYKDLLAMQQFYEEVLGLSLVADQGWTKIYQVSNTGFIGLVDERRGMHSFTEEKGVTVSFFLEDPDGWFQYVKQNQTFPLRSQKMEIGPESKYRAFVGYDPEGYFMEFDIFNPHSDNTRLLEYLKQIK